MQVEKFYYDNRIVKNFAYATILWGVVGMLAGLWVALQLVFPSLNITQYGSFGRLRPLHTNAVIFALWETVFSWACITRCKGCVKRVCSAMC